MIARWEDDLYRATLMMLFRVLGTLMSTSGRPAGRSIELLASADLADERGDE